MHIKTIIAAGAASAAVAAAVPALAQTSGPVGVTASCQRIASVQQPAYFVSITAPADKIIHGPVITLRAKGRVLGEPEGIATTLLAGTNITSEVIPSAAADQALVAYVGPSGVPSCS